MKSRIPTVVVALYLLLGLGDARSPGRTAQGRRLTRASNPLILDAARRKLTVTPESLTDPQTQGEFSQALTTILEAAPNGFADLRGGPGRKIEDSIHYPCTVSLPGATKMYVSIPQTDDDKPYVGGDFYSGMDLDAAEKIFNRLVAQVKAALPNWVTDEKKSETPNHTHKYHFTQEEKSLKVTVDLYSFKSTGDIRLAMYIEAPRPSR